MVDSPDEIRRTDTSHHLGPSVVQREERLRLVASGVLVCVFGYRVFPQKYLPVPPLFLLSLTLFLFSSLALFLRRPSFPRFDAHRSVHFPVKACCSTYDSSFLRRYPLRGLSSRLPAVWLMRNPANSSASLSKKDRYGLFAHGPRMYIATSKKLSAFRGNVPPAAARGSGFIIGAYDAKVSRGRPRCRSRIFRSICVDVLFPESNSSCQSSYNRRSFRRGRR